MTKPKIFEEQVNFDDATLINKFTELKNDFCAKKQNFENKLKSSNIDYLNVAVARLAYEFSKEEYNDLFSEIQKRGLKTSS